MAERSLTLDQLSSHIKDVMGKEFASLFKATMSDQVAEVKRMLAESGGSNGGGGGGYLYQPPGVAQIDQSMVAARLIRALAAGKNDPQRAAAWANKNWDGDHDPITKSVMKALGTSDGTAGGFLVPTQLSQDIIQYLRPQAVIRRLGPTTVPMPVGTIRLPKLTSGSAASYIGENTNIGKTQPVFGQIVLTFKKLAALVPVSNDLLRYSSPGADGIVRDDLVRAMAQREDQGFIRDDGTSNTPKGLRYWAPAANVIASAGTTLANILTDLGGLILALRNNNVPMVRPAWIMPPRCWNTLMTIQNTNGFYVFRQEMLGGLTPMMANSLATQMVFSQGTLWGYPYAVTTQIPTNLGGGGNAAEVYLVDMADAAIGEAQNLIVDTSTEAAYYDGANVVPAYSQDQTVVRAIAEHDFAMRRDVAVGVLTGVTW